MLLFLASILLLVWLLPITFHFTAWFIHVLLLVAVIGAILHIVRPTAGP